MRNYLLLIVIIMLSTACSKKNYVEKPIEEPVDEVIEEITEEGPTEIDEIEGETLGETDYVPTDVDFDEISKGMCFCATPLLKSMEKLTALTEAGDTEGLTALATEMEPIAAEMEKCIAELEAKYPSIDGNPEYEEKAMAALRKNCPDLAAALEEPE